MIPEYFIRYRCNKFSKLNYHVDIYVEIFQSREFVFGIQDLKKKNLICYCICAFCNHLKILMGLFDNEFRN